MLAFFFFPRLFRGSDNSGRVFLVSKTFEQRPVARQKITMLLPRFYDICFSSWVGAALGFCSKLIVFLSLRYRGYAEARI